MMQGGGFAKRKVARYKTIPAPVGGWNARDALAAMSPLDAVTLDNFFPITSGVMLRKGYTQWATGLTTDVESLLPYTSGTTQNNKSSQKDYQLVLEVLDIHTGDFDKESATIRKGYHKTGLGKLKNYGAG